MRVPSPIVESEPVARLAGELRVSICKLRRRLREQSHSGDFAPSQKSVILRLERDGPATVSVLAKAESVRHQSMRITVAKLQSLGVVTGEPDPNDRRQTIFRLTPAYLRTLKISRTVKEDWLYRALDAQLTPVERTRLAAAVKLLNRVAEF